MLARRPCAVPGDGARRFWIFYGVCLWPCSRWRCRSRAAASVMCVLITIITVLIYPDVREAVAWLTAAFGFVERLRIGENHRSQLRVGDGAVIVAGPGGYHRPPSREAVAQYVMVRVPDARSHCERARAHGAVILAEPADYMYGERQYGAEDFAGHRWTFTETLSDTDPQTWGGQYLNPD